MPWIMVAFPGAHIPPTPTMPHPDPGSPDDDLCDWNAAWQQVDLWTADGPLIHPQTARVIAAGERVVSHTWYEFTFHGRVLPELVELIDHDIATQYDATNPDHTRFIHGLHALRAYVTAVLNPAGAHHPT